MFIINMGVSENVVYPEKPNGFADHYPYEMAISLGIYPIFRQTHMDASGAFLKWGYPNSWMVYNGTFY